MGKVRKALGLLILLALLVVLFVLPTMMLAKTWLIWRVFWGYVEGASNLTGLNQYLVTALALVMLVPFYFGADMLFPSGDWCRGRGGTRARRSFSRWRWGTT
jgi:hypothetical protein